MMELDYMDGDRERQWLAIANSNLRSQLRAIQQEAHSALHEAKSDLELINALVRIEDIASQ